MQTKYRRVASYSRPIIVVALCLILTGLLVAASPSGSAQAAGEWTTGQLTNNSAFDLSPALSSTHLVWAQLSGAVWNINLRELATETTEVICTAPAWRSPASPLLSIAGDYVTIYATEDNKWQLHEISSGTTRTFPIAGVTSAEVHGTDGAYVVGVVDDGTDMEIVAYDIDDDRWISTINGFDDISPSLDAGRVVWQTAQPGSKSIVLFDLSAGTQRTLVTLSTDLRSTLQPIIKGDWVGYRDIVTDKFCLHRLSDGFNLQAGSSPRKWSLTEHYAFWTEYRPGFGGTDLYAIDLDTLVTTRVTADALFEIALAADGARAVYLAAPAVRVTGDLMVVDLDETPVAPHRLAQNVSLSEFGAIPSICDDWVVAGLYDGTDFEICWARWTEEEPPEPPEPSHAFTDVPAEHPYSTAIYDLADREVINGYPDDTFRPNNIVLRQQFAKMIVLSLGYPVSDTDICTFTDVQTSVPGSYVDPTDPNYPDHYVAVCAAYGITEGKTPSTFAPYDGITRQQLITMVARAASLPDPPADYTPEFAPAQFYPEEHYANARRAAYAGLLDGLVGVGSSYDFFAASTRGECAQLLYNLLNRLD